MDDSGGSVKAVNLTSNKTNTNFEFETEQWLPNEAYSVAHAFREHHGNDLTPQLINQLLGDLNRIWRERERKQINRIK